MRITSHSVTQRRRRYPVGGASTKRLHPNGSTKKVLVGGGSSTNQSSCRRFIQAGPRYVGVQGARETVILTGEGIQRWTKTAYFEAAPGALGRRRMQLQPVRHHSGAASFVSSVREGRSRRSVKDGFCLN